MQLSTKHLIGIKYLPVEDISLILSQTAAFKDILQRPVKKTPALRDVTVANLFFENSTRTRISFELAEKRLGADVINFSAGGSSVAKGETLLDTVHNILSMKVDMLVVRHSASGALQFLYKQIPNTILVNAGDGINEHPTQALLDAFTLQEKFGSLQKLKVLIVGDIMHSRVALSNIFLLKKMGAEVRVSGPPTMIPAYLTEALDVPAVYDIDEALAWADAAIILRIQLERQQKVLFSSLREYHLSYGITPERLKKLTYSITIMHPGPINRGVEIDSAVADDTKHSLILEQVENGVATRMAVLYLLASKLNSNSVTNK